MFPLYSYKWIYWFVQTIQTILILQGTPNCIMISGLSFSTSILDQALSTETSPKGILGFNDLRDIEKKLEQTISTLNEVLTELHTRRDALSSLTSAFYAPHSIDTTDVNQNELSTTQKLYLPYQDNMDTYPSTTFTHGVNPGGVAIVKLVAREDVRNVNKCGICDKEFEDRLKLRNHSRIHKQTRKHKCEVCSLGFPVPSKLKEHMRTHTGERPYQCAVCLRCFTKSSSLKRHRQVHKSQFATIPTQLGTLTLLQDQVVQNVDRPLSPAFEQVQIETKTALLPYHENDAFLTHIESDISPASASP